MKRTTIFIYGIVSYLIGASAYFGGLSLFLANRLGPYSVDQGVEAPFAVALAINLGLIILWGLPHSLMARPDFKQWWTRIVPPAAERSTYMLQSGLLAFLLIWQWRAMPTVIWQIENAVAIAVIWMLFVLGWIIALISTFLINHFQLTGLQQVYANLRGKELAPPTFYTPFLYKIVRHPLQMGVLMAFWAAPVMTVGHLLFAISMTIYIFIGLYFEERDLVRAFGDTYEAYQQTTPKLIPGLPRGSTRPDAPQQPQPVHR